MNCKNVLENIRRITKDYIVAGNLKSLILGVSGGIDSTLVAIIVKPICDELHIPLIGVSLPSTSNKDTEIGRSYRVSRLFCDLEGHIGIDTIVTAFEDMLEIFEVQTIKEKISIGNIKARVRMVILYDYAYQNNGMVLSTDNLTEYYLGFWTLHGDVGDFSPIQYLWKTEVYELAKWIQENEYKKDSAEWGILEDCINATPTDGLGITNSDLDQLGVGTYEEVDTILQAYLTVDSIVQKCIVAEDATNPVIQRYLRTQFKRNNPYCIARGKLFEEIE